MAADDDPEASVLDSELSDINAEWTKDCPGQGCTLEDLRWYVVREIGEIKQHAINNQRVVNKQHINLEILKVKNGEKPSKDDVESLVKKMFSDSSYSKAEIDKNLHDGLGALRNDMTQFCSQTDNHMNEIYKKIGEGMQTTKVDHADGKFKELDKTLQEFEKNIKDTIEHIVRVEGAFQDFVGQGFAALSKETDDLKQAVNLLGLISGAQTPSSSAQNPSPSVGPRSSGNRVPNSSIRFCPYGTSPSAGAHDGKGPGDRCGASCEGCEGCHCHHVETLWQEFLRHGGYGGERYREGIFIDSLLLTALPLRAPRPPLRPHQGHRRAPRGRRGETPHHWLYGLLG